MSCECWCDVEYEKSVIVSMHVLFGMNKEYKKNQTERSSTRKLSNIGTEMVIYTNILKETM